MKVPATYTCDAPNCGQQRNGDAAGWYMIELVVGGEKVILHTQWDDVVAGWVAVRHACGSNHMHIVLLDVLQNCGK